jgi:IS5 family transposase
VGKTSKSPKAIIKKAYEIGQRTLPLRWHKFSPRTFSPAQLFACLVVKAHLAVDYRHMEQILIDFPDLCAVIGMKKAPDFTTLCKAEKRLLDKATTRKLLQESISDALSNRQMKRLVELAAIDGSGFESRHISDHYLKRQNLTGKKIPHKKHPKLGLVVDAASHMILALETGRGPKPDIVDLEKLLAEATTNTKIKCLAADAGYDSERSHRLVRQSYGIRSLIPPLVGRPSISPPTGFYRRLMTYRFDSQLYGQRWQVETVFSMLKRLLRSALTARSYFSQCRELRLKAITLNIMILKSFFYR